MSGAYRLSATERAIGILPVLWTGLAFAVMLGVGNMTEGLNELSMALAGDKESLLPILFFGPIVVWAISDALGDRKRLRKWLHQQGLHTIRFQKTWFKDHPWRGVSDSQTVYMVTAQDARGKERNCFILWGGFFGCSWLTGEIPAQLMWDRSEDTPDVLQEAAERVAKIRTKDPMELFKPRW